MQHSMLSIAYTRNKLYIWFWKVWSAVISWSVWVLHARQSRRVVLRYTMVRTRKDRGPQSIRTVIWNHESINFCVRCRYVSGRLFKNTYNLYKLTCTNCNNFYIGRTNRNFNTRFKEHRKDFRYAEGKSKFSEHVLNEGH